MTNQMKAIEQYFLVVLLTIYNEGFFNFKFFQGSLLDEEEVGTLRDRKGRSKGSS